MSLTRKMLKAMELDEDKISQILDAHKSVVDEVASERDNLQTELNSSKEEVKRLSSVEKDLAKAKADLEEFEKTSEKLKNLQEEFSTYKADVDAKSTKDSKSKAYKALLTKANIPDKRHDAILKVTDLDVVELDADGNITNEDALIKSINTEWAEFQVTEQTTGVKTSTPPSNNQNRSYSADDIKKMSAEEINKNWDSIKNSLGQI